jgi:hypothetical protein
VPASVTRQVALSVFSTVSGLSSSPKALKLRIDSDWFMTT